MCGCHMTSRRTGAHTRPVGESGIRTTAGPRSTTPSVGPGGRTTTAAGSKTEGAWDGSRARGEHVNSDPAPRRSAMDHGRRRAARGSADPLRGDRPAAVSSVLTGQEGATPNARGAPEASEADEVTSLGSLRAGGHQVVNPPCSKQECLGVSGARDRPQRRFPEPPLLYDGSDRCVALDGERAGLHLVAAARVLLGFTDDDLARIAAS